MTARAYTIGQVSRLSGVPVRRLRFYADKGLLPRIDRTDAGYRLFDEEDLVRVGLIVALRDAGLGLEAIREVLGRRRSIRDVLSLRLAEIETQIASQSRVASAIRTALRSSEPTSDDLRRIWTMTNLSNAERVEAIRSFLDEVADGADVDPSWKGWMLRMSAPNLPEDPSPDQLDAWIELSALLKTPDFKDRMRRNAQDSVIGLDVELFQQVQASILPKAKSAIESGLEPGSPEGRAVAKEYLEGWARATRREPTPETMAQLRRKLIDHKPAMYRYWSLVATLNGLPGRSTPTPEWLWIDRAAAMVLAEA
ncbi:MerR family transcriptional regulator [Methylopila jiangsuensis]|uniref:MerR family transcriptional regulator n=1 Tax=Methylopila jiangsuensis TaxID=586230 RepID=A0A9W6N2K2_9HYPH|nr:MerR family transcriptional regulator [Methylopila jiangsuensis]MDR6286296.1 DNA-binding transcriptional MerR regulator [Methylopila jiangsuensis]GLK76059.1 MerR family transcriptional regulator [Methylopila jiangsuensis]